MARGRTTHGQLVSWISSPSTGPATASTAERGWSDVRSRIADLDGIVDCREIGRLHDRELLGFRIGIDENCEARIGAADVADQDRKLEDAFVAILVCHDSLHFVLSYCQLFFFAVHSDLCGRDD